MPGDRAPREFDVPVAGGLLTGAQEIADSPFDELPEEGSLEIEGAEGDDPGVAIRRTLGMSATGVTIITLQTDDRVHGMTANAFMMSGSA